MTLEQRTPTPETETELDEAEITRVESAKSVNITEASVSKIAKIIICI